MLVAIVQVVLVLISVAARAIVAPALFVWATPSVIPVGLQVTAININANRKIILSILVWMQVVQSILLYQANLPLVIPAIKTNHFVPPIVVEKLVLRYVVGPVVAAVSKSKLMGQILNAMLVEVLVLARVVIKQFTIKDIVRQLGKVLSQIHQRVPGNVKFVLVHF